MRVGVIDVGSNTARLLVARRGIGVVVPVHEERALLALGDEIERFGRISDLKLVETAERARRYAQRARELGCGSLAVIVTAPGRRSENAAALLGVLERATGVPARVLSAAEEGRLAFDGAIMNVPELPARVTVCDVGGGPTEVATGTPAGGPERCRSLDVGSLALTRRFFDADPPGKKALATGGAARALRRLTGMRSLGPDELARAARTLAKRTSVETARELGLDLCRPRARRPGMSGPYLGGGR